MRYPFDPPYTAKDLPQLDLLHELIGLYEQWMDSARRHEIEMTPDEEEKPQPARKE